MCVKRIFKLSFIRMIFHTYFIKKKKSPQEYIHEEMLIHISKHMHLGKNLSSKRALKNSNVTDFMYVKLNIDHNEKHTYLPCYLIILEHVGNEASEAYFSESTKKSQSLLKTDF